MLYLLLINFCFAINHEKILEDFKNKDIKIFNSAYSFKYLAEDTQEDPIVVAVSRFYNHQKLKTNDVAHLFKNRTGYYIKIGDSYICVGKGRHLVKCEDDKYDLFTVAPVTFGWVIRKNDECLTQTGFESVRMEPCVEGVSQVFDFKLHTTMNQCEQMAKELEKKEESKEKEEDKKKADEKNTPDENKELMVPVSKEIANNPLVMNMIKSLTDPNNANKLTKSLLNNNAGPEQSQKSTACDDPLEKQNNEPINSNNQQISNNGNSVSANYGTVKTNLFDQNTNQQQNDKINLNSKPRFTDAVNNILFQNPIQSTYNPASDQVNENNEPKDYKSTNMSHFAVVSDEQNRIRDNTRQTNSFDNPGQENSYTNIRQENNPNNVRQENSPSNTRQEYTGQQPQNSNRNDDSSNNNVQSIGVPPMSNNSEEKRNNSYDNLSNNSPSVDRMSKPADENKNLNSEAELRKDNKQTNNIASDLKNNFRQKNKFVSGPGKKLNKKFDKFKSMFKTKFK